MRMRRIKILYVAILVWNLTAVVIWFHSTKTLGLLPMAGISFSLFALLLCETFRKTKP